MIEAEARQRFVVKVETGPHRIGKPERWAVYERIGGGAGLALRYRAKDRQDAVRERLRRIARRNG